MVDLPPGTGDTQLSLAQLVPVTGAVMVTTPQEVSVIDVEKALAMWKKVEVPVLGIVENMSYFACPECGHHEEIFARGGGRPLAEREGLPFLGEIPMLSSVRGSGDAGKPIVLAEPESEVAQTFTAIARRLACALSVRNLPDPGTAKRSSKLSVPAGRRLDRRGRADYNRRAMSDAKPAPRETIFSGIQPSGELHLGNYLGAIRNWVALQSSYRCFYCIVDYHAITQPFEPAHMAQRVRDMAGDLIACGIDPAKSTLFVQSAVPEHTELAWALASVTGYGELGRMTQFKDKSEKNPENINAGLFTYPVLQAADILIYRATKVPVGEDQRQHLELAREIVRKWNARFGETFPEPEALYSSTPKILGLDGQAKMSKSLGNTISLREDDDAVWDKLRTAATDPARVRRSDPGDPDKCNIFTLHKFFSTDERQAEVRRGCTTAGIGCIECKKWLCEGVKADLERIRARRAELLATPEAIDEILADGARRARAGGWRKPWRSCVSGSGYHACSASA